MHSTLARFGTNGISSGDGNKTGTSEILKIIGVRMEKRRRKGERCFMSREIHFAGNNKQRNATMRCDGERFSRRIKARRAHYVRARRH